MRITASIIVISGVALVVILLLQYSIHQREHIDSLVQAKQYDHMYQQWFKVRANRAQVHLQDLQDAGCARALIAPICIDWGAEYLPTPESVRGIYLTSHAVGDANIRARLLRLVEDTEINTVVIDIKETDGIVATHMGDYAQIPFQEERMPGIQSLLEELYEREVYTIARIVLFKDQRWTEVFPEDAVKRKDDPQTVWTDYRGKKYVDPGAQAYWEYLVALSMRVHQMGFDEIQVDYVRFPSDGNMANTYYPHSQDKLDVLGGMNGRVAVIDAFSRYYTSALRAQHPDIVLSADTFGMTTSLNNDLTIGQMQDSFMKYFDYVSPMVYPSHYPEFFVPLEGHPDNHPYEVVKKAMDDGVAKAQRAGQDPDKLRPWLQDFTCSWCEGYYPYGAREVREQIQATYDAELDSWLLWNAGSRYTKTALEKIH
jgi:hypothetical protein